jgi:hydrogenase expression/formation protein HypD
VKYVDGFRDPAAAAALRRSISRTAESLAASRGTVRIMEVCGTHTMAIARHGIRGVLPDNVDLVSGPGCPVCVTHAGYIDNAIALAERGVCIVTFGDMLHVPGSTSTLAGARAGGAAVETAYSPATAIETARSEPGRQVVFLAIGFETTIAPLVSLVDEARAQGIGNLTLLTAFKLVPPALSALRADRELAIDAFLCPAHVSAIIGSDAYRPFAGPGGVPCVIAGFEPLDILLGIDRILRQLAEGRAEVENLYDRVVRPQGNPRAQALMRTYLRPVDARWRGIGTIPQSGLGLRPEYEQLDSAVRFGLADAPGSEPRGCLCGEVIKGKRKPPACPMFGKACTPDSPVGPCMVSSEGSCAAYYKYREEP